MTLVNRWRLWQLSTGLAAFRTMQLRRARRRLLAELLSPKSTVESRQAAWNKYQEVFEASVNILHATSQPPAEIGLILDKARLYHRAGYFVEAGLEVIDAYNFAFEMRFDELAGKIKLIMGSKEFEGLRAVSLQHFDTALEEANAIENRKLSPTERGLLNLRMAYCYRELLLHLDDERLNDLLIDTVATAFECLKGHRSQLVAVRLLDEIEA